jgi:pyridinium-3,5-bisthiocarboxylic acid mononucleotide nickel chelatase
LGMGPIDINQEAVLVGGLSALRVTVDAPQEPLWGRSAVLSPQAATHEHRPYRRIRDLLAQATLAPRVKARAQAAFRLLAEAEAEVHGVDPETVEFHEVGSLDAIADVVGCCLALELLKIDRIISSSLTPGHGTVRCAHGLMPVPVPAVARMLDRVLPRSGVRAPWRSLDRETGELTTPTGAALICAH